MSEEPALHCAHCKQEIADKSYAKVGNLAYHVDHFVCGACLTTLAGKKFKSYQEKVYCLDCYAEKFAITCAGCKLKIIGKYVKVEQAKFHKDCFVCQYCTEAFNEEGYYMDEEGKYICSKCQAIKQDRKCEACNQLIEGNSCFALDAYWHVDCFKCHKCKKQIKNQAFVSMDEKPFHELCVNQNCVVCSKNCDDEYYEVENQNICHVECIDSYDPKIHVAPVQQNEQPQEEQKQQAPLTPVKETVPKQVQPEAPSVEVPKVQVPIENPKEVPKVEEVQQQQVKDIPKEEPKTTQQQPQQQDLKEVEVKQEQEQKQVEQVKQPESQAVKVDQQQLPKVEEKQQVPVIEKQEKKVEAPKEEQKQIQQEEIRPPQTSKYQLKSMGHYDANQLDPNVLNPDRPRFPYDKLIENPPPEGVVPNKKELYLSDAEFEKIFKMKLKRFLALKEQKRVELKKQYKLF